MQCLRKKRKWLRENQLLLSKAGDRALEMRGLCFKLVLSSGSTEEHSEQAWVRQGGKNRKVSLASFSFHH